ncbi:ATP-binding protein [uncultured Jannaschia sp.]|uniref:hybrid sensor histidine kinase/response regulator n=1 Tax=uncultured Jannaschia sp. TaxID=293347 RepID=UPI0026267548|nr:ATP-binding protein [uncultured Jannaschia sp.]
MGDTAQTLNRLRTGSTIFFLAALAAVLASFVVELDVSRALLLALAGSLAAIPAALQIAANVDARMERRRLKAVMEFLEFDTAPGLCTDEAGTVFAQNAAAIDKFGAQDGAAMTTALEALFANPDAVVHRLRHAARGQGSAHEDVVTRRGHVRVAVRQIPGGLLWRFVDLVDRPARARDGIGLPMLAFGPSGTVLYTNEVLRAQVGHRAERLRDLFQDLPLVSGGLNRLLTDDGPQPVRVILSESVNGRSEVFVMPATEHQNDRVGLDSLPVALLRLDSEGRVLSANRLARDLLPATASPGEVRLAAMVEGLGRSVREWVSEAAAGRGLYRAEVVRVTGAEVETYLQITLGRPVDDAEGGLLAVLNDATELKTLEAQFVQSQKMQAIGQLAGGVAHDFNNLLTAISGHCDLLLLRHEEGDEDFADLKQINQNANRAAALVGQLLAFSRKQKLQMQPVDLRDTLSDLAHLLNRLVGDNVRLTLQHDPGLIPVRGDRRQLEQVLMNLVVNARDAMPEGGEIRIETECRFLNQPQTRDRVTMPPGQYVVITVTDEGLGISSDNLGRIFEPFFTTKRPGEGTGLGLSMAYGIVKQSGGYIFADSELGVGTRFSLYFPAMPDDEKVADLDDDPDEMLASPAVATPAVPANPVDLPAAPERPGSRAEDGDAARAPAKGDRDAGSGREDVDPGRAGTADEADRLIAKAVHAARAKTGGGANGATVDAPAETTGDRARPVVLLVEDEAPVRAFASRALRLRGYDVVEAENAESALAQLSDASLVVDLFVTDVMMPGLDGPSWVRKALEDRPKVRTVFISGYTQDALSETSAPVPNATFLAKPFSLNDLTRTVEQALQ